MDQKAEFAPTPRPVQMGSDGRPWPLCPCGRYQSTSPTWQGWQTCPCGGAVGEVCSTGTPRWLLSDQVLIEQQRVTRQK